MEPIETVEEYKKKKELKTVTFMIMFHNISAFILLMMSLFMVLISDDVVGVLKAIFFVIISCVSSLSSILYAIRKDIKSQR
jgi:hypothetical protein